ncbi:CPBP family intramembrane glutamic endopeptidase [Cyanobium sp. ATX 6F1]|uniref:CPBP family intramembrane glutamic endopeptidase n=1 Tax=Cyanobium sp. ATX 6F1 TaxID=2823702 RepID=UPI0020CF3542|nr:CPBP family intramembrane glutamic endopeptidase [Cyanobium sp. ATX 6F1]MCP9917322.1 CPBP family intramembrane metalloprotease [Cyanobium sp. ATX 6F1]
MGLTPPPAPVTHGGGRRPGGWLLAVGYLPLLLLSGWLLARPLALLAPGLRPDQVNLAGTLVSFALLLLTLPAWLRRRWGEPRAWRRLGVAVPLPAALQALLRGLLKALLLLALVCAGLLLGGAARTGPGITPAQLANALALMLGVGFAEELLFRGWLWGELALGLGGQRALLAQALIFSLVHPYPLAQGWLALLALKGGLLLLGIALALQRRSDGGVLWGAVGLHGGLVGGWFLLQGGLISLSPGAPLWLVGPGGASPNPIGGLLGWLGLAALLAVRRRWWGENPKPIQASP